MKNRNNVFTTTFVALAFAFAPVVQAGPRLDGGPSYLASKIVNANSDAVASVGVRRVSHMANSPSQTDDRHPLTVFGSVDFQTCRVAHPPKIGRAYSGARGGFGNLCCNGLAALSYRQFEVVICGFLPSVNVARETGNY